MAPAATIEKRVSGSPAPERVVRDVGPLPCRFVADRALPDDKRPDEVPAIPTIKSMAAIAYRVLPAKADVWPNMVEGREHYRKGMLAAKPTREAAAFAVASEKLRKPDGELYTKGELAPLVTLVRKQLVADLRGLFKSQDRADVQRLKAQDQASKRKIKAAEKVRARAASKVHCAVLPLHARPTKVVARGTRAAQTPVLAGGIVVKEGRGRSTQWWLACTDSYQLTRFPLTIHGDAGLVDGMVISGESLKQVEQVGAFRLTGKGTKASPHFIQPVHYGVKGERIEVPGNQGADAFTMTDVPFAFDRGQALPPLNSQPPNVQLLLKSTLPRKPAPSRTIELTLDAAILAQIADSTKGLAHVTLVIDERALIRYPDGIRRPAYTDDKRAIEVRPTTKDVPDQGIRALQMLVKTN